MSEDEQVPEPDSGVTIAYPHSLFLHVGAVAVMGARVEVALVRLLRHMEKHRLGEPHKEVMWREAEAAIREGLVNVDPSVAAEVVETLDWAAALDLRGRRNDAIHTEYPLLPGDAALLSVRITRRSHAETMVAAYGESFTRLRETKTLLETLVTRLDAVTYWMAQPSWHRRVMARPGGSATWRSSTA